MKKEDWKIGFIKEFTEKFVNDEYFPVGIEVGYAVESFCEKFIDNLLSKEREKAEDEIWDMLIMSLPPDAENIASSRQLDWQSKEVLNGFLDKLKGFNYKKK